MIKHFGTQTIKTPRLVLRRFSPDDAPAMYQNWAGDERVARHMFWKPFHNEEEVREELAGWQENYQSDQFYRWAIVEKESGAAIGSIGLTNAGDEKSPRWEPAYLIGHAYWGHGYTAEALGAVVDFFWDTGVDRLFAAHSEQNPASGRVLGKVGFEYRYQDAYQKPDGAREPASFYRLKRPRPRHVGTRPIETERLRLRRFTMDDAGPMYHGWATDGDVTRYMSWDPHQNLEETRSLLREWVDGYQNPESYNWAIEETATGALIGSIGVLCKPEDHIPTAEWQPGYCLAKPYWGKGYATEALLAVMDYFTRCTGITDLYCCHATGNPASGRVMEKAGFVYDHDGTITKFSGAVLPAKYYLYHPQEEN